MADLLKGKPVVDAMAESLSARVVSLKEQGVVPTLAIVRVGARPDDLSYERTALKRADSLGIATRVFELPDTASQSDLEATIDQINADDTIHGCLMFRPLPNTLDEDALCQRLDSGKDIDGISTASLGAVFVDAEEGFAPCTAKACITMLEHYGIELEGKSVVVVGRSLVIGKPVALLALRKNATVTICHSRTKNLPEVMSAADIVICATGRARFYGKECFKPGQIVLDVGINFDEEGMCGDVNFAEVEPVVAAITPVPGGIGSVTTSTTMAHVVEAAERFAAKK